MAIASSLVVGAGTACSPTTTGAGQSSPIRKAPGTTVFPAPEISALVDGIVHKTVKKLPITRLADNLMPPTNRWFSGLVFGETPQPVFPMPLSFGLTEDGFAFGLPTITATEKNIAGGYKADVTIVTGSRSAQVSAYDTATVTLAGLDTDGQPLGHTVIAQGSPFVSYTAAKKGELSTALGFAETGDFWTAEAGDVAYGLVVSDGSVSGGTISLDKGGVATWFVIPADGSAEQLAGLAKSPVTGSTLAYTVEDDTVTSSITYLAEGDTAFASMPHQQHLLSKNTSALGTYPSIYGTLTLHSGRVLAWSAPLSAPTSKLDLGSLSDDQRSTLVAQVKRDAGVPRRQLLRRQGPVPGGHAAPARAAARGRRLRVDAADVAGGRAEEVDRASGSGRAAGLLLRLRRARQGRGRSHSLLRVGGVQRPPLPLRVLPLRGGDRERGRPAAGGRAGTGDEFAGSRHRFVGRQRLLP